MRVLHINCNYVSSALHRTMIHHLDALGVENTVFAPIHSQAEAAQFGATANELVSVCFGKWDRLFFFYKQGKIRRAAEGEAFAGGRRYDCLHAYTLFTDGVCARALARRHGLPYVVAVRNTDVNAFFRYKPYLRGLGVRVMRDAAAVLFLSDAYRARVPERYVPARDRAAIARKALVVPNGIDDFWLDNPWPARDLAAGQARLDSRTLNAVCVGRIDRNKNIPTVQRALALLRDEGWTTRLTVIGRNADAAEFAEIARDPCTTCLDPMDKEHLIHEYRRNDLFLLASRAESFGLVYAEAMSQGLPVLYTRGQGFDGQFPEGQAGWPVDADNPAGIAAAVKRVAADYTALAGRCPALAADRFRWDDICRQYAALYREAVAGARSAANK